MRLEKGRAYGYEEVLRCKFVWLYVLYLNVILIGKWE